MVQPKNKKVIKRVIADVVLFSAIFFAPWYWTAGLAVLFIILFPRYWEAVLAGFLLDAMYSVPTQGFYGRFGIFTISALILLLVLGGIKKRIRFFE